MSRWGLIPDSRGLPKRAVARSAEHVVRVEVRVPKHALKECGGRVEKAAARLGARERV